MSGCQLGEWDNLKSICVSYKQAKCFNEQMKRSMFSFYKLKSRLPGGKIYEDLRYEWHRFWKSMNWKCFKQKSKLNAISLTELKFYVEAAFTKFSEWSHEKEYRYVILSDSFSEENDKYLTRNIPINRVFCGCRGAGKTVINSAGETMHTERVPKHKRIFELE